MFIKLIGQNNQQYKVKQTILFPPRIKIVTAREFLHSSINNILSFVVPKESSLTLPA
jgi:hypothetical protein